MRSGIFSFKIRKDKVVETIKQTAWLGIVIAIIGSLAIPLMMIFYKYSFSQILMSNLWVGVVIVLVSSIGVYCKSRVAAVALVFYYIFSLIYTLILSVSAISFDLVFRVLISLLILLSFIKGAKAVFLYHKHIKSKL